MSGDKPKKYQSDIQSVMNVANKGAQLASQYTPKFAKRGLTGIKHLGQWGVGKVLNSRLSRYAGDKMDDLSNKKITGQALSFNAGKPTTRLSDIKTIGDLANIDAMAQMMLLIIGFLFFIIFSI